MSSSYAEFNPETGFFARGSNWDDALMNGSEQYAQNIGECIGVCLKDGDIDGLEDVTTNEEPVDNLIYDLASQEPPLNPLSKYALAKGVRMGVYGLDRVRIDSEAATTVAATERFNNIFTSVRAARILGDIRPAEEIVAILFDKLGENNGVTI